MYNKGTEVKEQIDVRQYRVTQKLLWTKLKKWSVNYREVKISQSNTKKQNKKTTTVPKERISIKNSGT